MSDAANFIDIKVPDIGDFDEVTVIEVLVKPGDSIKAEQSLITVESDKASMEIPSSAAGVVKEVKVKLGDKVKQGSVVLTLAASASNSPSPQPSPKGAWEQNSLPLRFHSLSRPRERAGVRAPRPQQSPQPASPAPLTSTAICWCWAPVQAATLPPSARQTWG